MKTVLTIAALLIAFNSWALVRIWHNCEAQGGHVIQVGMNGYHCVEGQRR